jgi:hypothetical protein
LLRVVEYSDSVNDHLVNVSSAQDDRGFTLCCWFWM